MRIFRANTRTLLVALALASACGESVPFAPQPDPQPSLPSTVRPDLIALQCTVNAVARSFGCAPVKSSSANGDYIVGGQGINVLLTSSNVSYDVPTQTLGADVTVQNLLPDALGTIDGTTLSATGVRVFFDSDPVLTSGSGSVSVQNADGQATFTNTNQDYFQYSQVLAPNAVSSSKRWLFNLSNGTTFSFVVYVSAPVQSRLVVSEVMANPQVAADASGEWIEIYNAGRTDVDLAGWAIKSNTNQSITIAPDATTCGSVGCTLIVPKGGYVVLSNNLNSATNGGVPVEYQWPDGTGPAQINLAN
ncbi:MAG: lamin tail domain-containing protein [bacterium]